MGGEGVEMKEVKGIGLISNFLAYYEWQRNNLSRKKCNTLGSAMPLLSNEQRKMGTQEVHINMFFVNVKNWKQLKCSPTRKITKYIMQYGPRFNLNYIQ